MCCRKETRSGRRQKWQGTPYYTGGGRSVCSVQCAVCRKGPAKRVRVRMPRADIQDVCDWMTGVMGAAEQWVVLFMLARTT